MRPSAGDCTLSGAGHAVGELIVRFRVEGLRVKGSVWGFRVLYLRLALREQVLRQTCLVRHRRHLQGRRKDSVTRSFHLRVTAESSTGHQIGHPAHTCLPG